MRLYTPIHTSRNPSHKLNADKGKHHELHVLYPGSVMFPN